jgi:hypothetical protein
MEDYTIQMENYRIQNTGRKYRIQMENYTMQMENIEYKM